MGGWVYGFEVVVCEGVCNKQPQQTPYYSIEKHYNLKIEDIQRGIYTEHKHICETNHSSMIVTNTHNIKIEIV